tara:strand:+ start:2120 stop:3055 length:936 start_codon:yes stop_codon:yes gene_type:complete
MIANEYINPKNSLVLYELREKLDFLLNLYNSNKLPKVLMISGKKGSGKFTLVSHFLVNVFDQDNYDIKNNTILANSTFYKQYADEIFPNIIHLSGDNFKNIKVDDIRDLKSTILKTTMSKKERFIILDDIELFNHNSLNALLKVIEEPSSNNHFILINNQTKPLIKTINSRSLELKIILDQKTRIQIINSLIKKNDLKVRFNFDYLNLTPGNFLRFNKICEENEININDNFLKNTQLLLNLYKKNKDLNLINMILLLTDIYFYNLREKNLKNIDKIVEDKDFVISNINKFLTYNLNQNSLLNAISNKLSNE